MLWVSEVDILCARALSGDLSFKGFDIESVHIFLKLQGSDRKCYAHWPSCKYLWSFRKEFLVVCQWGRNPVLPLPLASWSPLLIRNHGEVSPSQLHRTYSRIFGRNPRLIEVLIEQKSVRWLRGRKIIVEGVWHADKMLSPTIAKRSPKLFSIAAAVMSLRPKLRTVSIIPGILMAAPDRTERRRGVSGSPSFLFMSFSTMRSFCRHWSQTPLGSTLPWSLKALHTSVVMVSPGGTERPIVLISAKLAPLPPSKNFRSFPGPAWPLPKIRTCKIVQRVRALILKMQISWISQFGMICVLTGSNVSIASDSGGAKNEASNGMLSSLRTTEEVDGSTDVATIWSPFLLLLTQGLFTLTPEKKLKPWAPSERRSPKRILVATLPTMFKFLQLWEFRWRKVLLDACRRKKEEVGGRREYSIWVEYSPCCSVRSGWNQIWSMNVIRWGRCFVKYFCYYVQHQRFLIPSLEQIDSFEERL